MQITLGFITSHLVEEHFKKIEHELSHFCKIIYLDGSNKTSIIKSYQDYENKVDAFLFSGRVVYYTLLKNFESPTKPCYYFDESNVDIKGIFLNLLIKNRDYDLRRIYVDSAVKDNDFLGIKKILPDDQLPYFTDFPYLDSDMTKLENQALSYHISLHEAGKIDLSITRLGNYIHEFEERKLPYIYAYPSLDYMVNYTMKIIQRVSDSKHQNTLLGSIIIAPKSQDGQSLPYASIIDAAHIRKKIQEFGQLKGYDFTLQETSNYVEALTYYKDIENITESFTSAKILDVLESLSDIQFFVGFGTGRNAYQARNNAKEALNLSIMKGDGLYCLTHDDKMMGPFSDDPEVYEFLPSNQLVQLSKVYHVDPLNLQKIMAYSQMIGSTTITSNGLAEYLKVSLRSANRLLTKILDNGGATSFLQNIDNKPGRPKKFYQLTFTEQF